MTDKPLAPPVARAAAHRLEAHGQVRTDPYFWLRDDDRERPEVLAYLEAENAYAEAVMAGSAELRETLYQEIVGRMAKDDTSVPYRRSGYWYYGRFEGEREHPIYCRRRDLPDAPEEIVVDANLEAGDSDYYALGGLVVSPGCQLLAFGEDRSGSNEFVLRFRDLERGEDLAETISDTSGVAVWARDDRSVFYVRKQAETLRPHQVWCHVVGTDPAGDRLVYEETDAEFLVTIRATRSRDFVLIVCEQIVTTEVHILDGHAPMSAPELVLAREHGHEYAVDHQNDGTFYVQSNWDAPDFRLFSTSRETLGDRAQWREEVPQRPGVFLCEFELFEDFLVLSEREEARTQLRVIPWRDRSAEYIVPFEDDVYKAEMGANLEAESTTLRIEYESMTTPPSVIDLDMATRTREVKKVQPVLGGFDSKDYESKRLWATAQDGAAVPISLVYRKDLDRSQPSPLLLSGYGAYGISTEPDFGSPYLSLLDRGFIIALAHVRGGDEKGRAWYDGGRLEHKMNSFTDFIAVSEHLIEHRFTTSAQLFAYGGSAGGLLVGAVANLRPDLYRGIIADVPFVDVVTTMLDDTVPLTTFEYDEWGNPDQPEAYRRMLRYSPYDNVEAKDYPAMLVYAGLHDAQVPYWEPAKWVAKLRATKTGDAPLLLVTNMKSGHTGASGRFEHQEKTALLFAFLLSLVGDTPEKAVVRQTAAR